MTAKGEVVDDIPRDDWSLSMYEDIPTFSPTISQEVATSNPTISTELGIGAISAQTSSPMTGSLSTAPYALSATDSLSTAPFAANVSETPTATSNSFGSTVSLDEVATTAPTEQSRVFINKSAAPTTSFVSDSQGDETGDLSLTSTAGTYASYDDGETGNVPGQGKNDEGLEFSEDYLAADSSRMADGGDSSSGVKLWAPLAVLFGVGAILVALYAIRIRKKKRGEQKDQHVAFPEENSDPAPPVSSVALDTNHVWGEVHEIEADIEAVDHHGEYYDEDLPMVETFPTSNRTEEAMSTADSSVTGTMQTGSLTSHNASTRASGTTASTNTAAQTSDCGLLNCVQ